MTIILDGTQGTTTPGLYSSTTFTGTYADGIVVDYTSTLGRISVGTTDGIAFYNGGVATTELMRIDSSGNVGIGTNAPGYKLEVNGTAKVDVDLNVGYNSYLGSTNLAVTTYVRGNPNWNYAGLNVIRNGSNNTTSRLIAMPLDGDDLTATTVGTYNAIWGTYNAIPTTGSTSSSLQGAMVYASYYGHQWWMNGSQKMFMDSNGNLLVNAGVVTIGDGTTLHGNVKCYVKGVDATSTNFGFYAETNAGLQNFSTRNDGAGYLRAAAWTYGSDASMKENIEYLEPANCLALVLQAKPAKFDYIDGQKKNYGYIANDVETWFPDAVEMMESGTRGLKDGFINALGTGAIQALNKLIQEQQAIIEQLRADVEQLKGKA